MKTTIVKQQTGCAIIWREGFAVQVSGGKPIALFRKKGIKTNTTWAMISLFVDVIANDVIFRQKNNLPS